MKYLNENGRSMVEMLGVLAIVGVLSVAGIAGYTSAMKKYKANELLNEASKRAAVIAMQIASGQTPSITEFGSNEVAGATFSSDIGLGTETFGMTLTGVDAAVCEQMKKILGSGATMAINEDCNGSDIILRFNKNLTKGEIPTETYSSSGSGQGQGGTTPEPTLVESCSSGAGVGFKYQGDSTNERTETANCRCPNNAPQWDGTQCKTAEIKGTCTNTNAHTTKVCDEGFYCKFTSPSDDDHGDGVCTKITGAKQSTDGHWVGPGLDWWSANSWCVSKGSTGLISYATLSKTVINGGFACDSSNPPFSSCDWDALENVGLTDYYWVGEDMVDNGGSWYVDVGSRDFLPSALSNFNHALCE